MTGIEKRMRWALARWMHRRGLPYWWVTPRWTQAEIDACKERGRQRAEDLRRYWE